MAWSRKQSVPPIRVADVAAAVGKGLAAGVVGTAVMTVSSSLEAKARGRGASTTPARVERRPMRGVRTGSGR